METKSNTSRGSIAWPLFVGIGSVLPWCAAELVIGWNPGVHAAALAVSLGVGIGLLLVGPLRWFSNDVWFATLVILPLPILHICGIHWALGRAIFLLPRLLFVVAWVQALSIGALLALLALALLRRRLPQRPFWRWFASGATMFGAPLLLVGPALEYSRATAPWTGDALWLAGLCLCAILPWRRVLCPPLAITSGICLGFVPDEYVPLLASFAAVTVGASLVSLREWSPRWFALDPPPRPSRVVTFVCLASGVAALAAAHALTQWSQPTWLSKRGRGGVATAIILLGRSGTDFDRDGYGMFFGQRDCRPFDATVHPGRLEEPGNGIDDNCMMGDAQESSVSFFKRVDAVQPPPAPFSHDVVVVLVDALRFDDATSLPLPAMQKLFRSGVFYERAYTTSTFTSQALMGILAGRLPTNIELKWKTPFNGCPVRAPGGLAVQLHEAGFDTAMVGFPNVEEMEYFRPHVYAKGFSKTVYLDYSASSDEVADHAIQTWKAMDQHKRRFLFAYFIQLHNSITSHSEYRTAIASFDRAFARLRAEIGSDVLWVLLADHGEEWYEHGHRGHAKTLFDEVVHVPLVIAGPDIVPRRIQQVSSLRSLSPTLLSMLLPQSDHALGPFLCVDQTGCKDQVAPLGLRMQTEHLHGLIVGHKKVIRDLRQGSILAYDLERDPQERSPLTHVPEELARQLYAWEEYGFSATGDEHLWPYTKPVVGAP